MLQHPRSRSAAVVSAVAAMLVLLTLGCGKTTAGSLVTPQFRAGGVDRPAGAFTFTNPLGWTIRLDTARIALGPFYFNISPPRTDEFRGGLVIVEVTRQIVVDALDPVVRDVAGGADGETGTAASVEIGLLSPDRSQSSSDRALLGDNVGIVAGVATRGSVTSPFNGPIAIDAALVTPQRPLAALQRVPGASVNLTFIPSPQVLELRVDPTHWFDQVDFAPLLQQPAANGVYSWDTHSTFLNQLIQGVKLEQGVYAFRLLGSP